MMETLHRLAVAAGIEREWQDVDGQRQTVSDESLIALLTAIGLPAGSASQINESQERLAHEASAAPPPLLTVDVHAPLPLNLPAAHGAYEVILESGKRLTGHLQPGEALPPLGEPGYHRLVIGDYAITVAAAPARAFTVADIGAVKLWGLAVQLYAMRRAHDGGIGDYAALAELATAAAGHGAHAIAISPAHAQFAANAQRFAPYAPSNRAAYNIYHIAESVPAFPDDDSLIDWPAANAAKLAALRNAFENFHDHAALAAFRAKAGPGLERHATFEALQASLSEHHPAAFDWRQWPEPYRDPENPAIYRFAQDNVHAITFHAYLQYRAAQGLAGAQAAARNAGMKIGLIADLAVGTDHAGSHSWSRQSEILQGLEIGAPPDAINREGQSWGITAFSPRGLRASGFAGFIEMLRHALSHAGGVRIDHVMGLARLWLIPQGQPCAAGAYLKLPVDDLLRLVVLESHRHRAIILGEDLGTLPHGFRDRLEQAGIAGLRVMWFERSGAHFTPPDLWSANAVGMTTTHDLPTVAGWWQGTDIAWRESLHMAGDDAETRAADRAELWAAFRNSSAATSPIPADTDGAAAADAACAHLGRAACGLTLLPIEDALATVEQPNLPGTTDEHPNWRRRLALPPAALLEQPAVAARLAALNTARTL